MRGHEALVAMRLRGQRPKAVFIDVGSDAFGDWREWPTYRPDLPCLCVSPGETIARLDLRCVNGLDVHVTAPTAATVEALVAACKEAGARVVWGITDDMAILIADNNGTPKWHE